MMQMQDGNVMQAIRNMEPGWEKVAGLKFQLGSYKDLNGQLRPCYQLTKTECLYIATKFNDEARAKLVLRWEELEMADRRRKMSEVRYLPSPQKILALADEIIGEGLRLVNADAEDTLTATQVAKTFNMTVFDFNHVLSDMGIQYRRHGRWNCELLAEGREEGEGLYDVDAQRSALPELETGIPELLKQRISRIKRI